MTMMGYVTKQAVMDAIKKLNPTVRFGKFRMEDDDCLEWCGSVTGENLNLPAGWTYSRVHTRIEGPSFEFYYWKERQFATS